MGVGAGLDVWTTKEGPSFSEEEATAGPGSGEGVCHDIVPRFTESHFCKGRSPLSCASPELNKVYHITDEKHNFASCNYTTTIHNIYITFSP